MEPTLAQLLGSPDHYFHSFDGRDAVFVPMDRAAYRRSIFLDRRISPAFDQTMRVHIASLNSASSALTTGWIFHVAHCGSTLLARGLDELSTANLVLREPLALRQLALAPDPEKLKLALKLLSKRFPGTGPTLIKANVPVNFLLDAIADEDSLAHVILLYCGLKDYLLAILRSANHRAWLRNVTSQLVGPLGDLSHLTDAEIGAALWLGQMRRFAATIKRMPLARSLDAEHFFGNPREILGAAAKHFGVEASQTAIEAIVSGPLFATYSKNPAQPFDNNARIERREALVAEISEELAAGRRWIENNAADVDAIMACIFEANLVSGRKSHP
jgi:hypothetical protein